jgi:hypothetical protein
MAYATKAGDITLEKGTVAAVYPVLAVLTVG